MKRAETIISKQLLLLLLLITGTINAQEISDLDTERIVELETVQSKISNRL